MSCSGTSPFWVVALKAVLIFVFLLVYTLFNIWFERRVVAKMQHRIGPNVHGPFGLLQSLADGVKLALKEDIVVKAADKVVYILAPILATIPAFLAWAVIPFGPEVTIPFTDTDDAAAAHRPAGRGALHPRGDLDRRLRHRARRLVVRLDLRPARRPALERPDDLVRGRDGPVVRLGVHVRRLDVDVGDRRRRRATMWYFVPLFPSFVIYVIAMVGETNRAPFDLPEAEGELVGGFHTEYSSLKFALFFLAEYVNMVTVSALATTLFLGGWRAPFGIAQIWRRRLNTGYWPLLWFFGKTLFFIFIFVWLRGTLPRMRYDQFMSFGWKILIPVSLAWIVAVAFIRKLKSEDMLDDSRRLLASRSSPACWSLLTFLIPEKKEPEPEPTSPTRSTPSPAATPYRPCLASRPRRSTPITADTTRDEATS